MAIRVYVEEAGCDRRQLDIEKIRRYLEANGYELVSDPAKADRILVSTCAFKEKEEKESVSRLRSLRKYGGEILVYGCLPDIAGDRYPEFDDLPHVAPRDIETIEAYFEATEVPFAEVENANVIPPAALDVARARRLLAARAVTWGESVRAVVGRGSRRLRAVLARPERPYFLFVCRGCQGSCSYCAIRRAIGPVRSRPVEEIVTEFRRGLDEGYRTFRILGDDPGCYGDDISESLPRLMGALFDAGGSAGGNDTAPRFEIREIHPKNLLRDHEAMLDLDGFPMISRILCPAQSGSDRILRLMRREHSAEDLLSALEAIRRRSPGLTLDTQVIVGFPTETEADFGETLEFLRVGGFDSAVVFPYHDKLGTVSSTLPGKVPDDVIRRRVREALVRLRRAGIAAHTSCPS